MSGCRLDDTIADFDCVPCSIVKPTGTVLFDCQTVYFFEGNCYTDDLHWINMVDGT